MQSGTDGVMPLSTEHVEVEFAVLLSHTDVLQDALNSSSQLSTEHDMRTPVRAAEAPRFRGNSPPRSEESCW